MSSDELQTQPETAPESGHEAGAKRLGYGLWPKTWRMRISLVLLILIGLVASAAWMGREKIAGDFIDDTLAANGLEAEYRIVSIGTQQQVIADLVLGDPEAPDFTADQVTLDIDYTFGAPEIGGVELVRPRLYGRVVDGQLSFGSLDPVIFAESQEPARLPRLNLKVDDGRALIESEFGAAGAKLQGEGLLADGFAGILAVTAPNFGTEQCRAESATLYGDLTTLNGRASLDGPLRLRDLSCAGAELASADVAARLTVWEDLSSLDGGLGIEALGFTYGDAQVAAINGAAQLLFGGTDESGLRLGLTHDLTATGITSEYAGLGNANLDGELTLSDGFTRSEWRSSLRGSNIRPATSIWDSLAAARSAGEGTLMGPLVSKFEAGLARAFDKGELSGNIILRNDDDGLRVTIPQARLRNDADETVLGLSKVSYGTTGKVGGDQLSGNILTGGTDMPLINGRMDRRDGGALTLRMTMAEYTVEGNSFAVPRMEIRQSPAGQIGFNGLVTAGGMLPGGSLRGLEMPVEGSWSERGGLALGTSCATVKFAALEVSQLALADRSVRLCPEEGAMVRYRDTLEVGAFSESLDIVGSIGESPTRITAERANLRYPGPFGVTGLSAMIGAEGNAVRLTAAEVSGEFGDAIGGRFAGGTAALDIVPLDLSELNGAWTFADGALSITEGAFVLSERPEPELRDDPRFWPLEAKGAVFTLIDNQIAANAELLHPETQSLITEVTLAHNLTTQNGRADIAVPGITFVDRFLEPRDLSQLASGVISLAYGTVEGSGVVTWDGDSVESSGRFRTDNFDFAAAFGPVKGARGEIVFTDLINLTTAPNQVLEVDSVNPGIEALAGRIVYSMTGGQLVTVEDARWPFMGGELVLQPVRLNFAEGEGQSYIFEVVGLDAAAFVAQMEMDNIGATGIFDGTIPIYFNESGVGTIEGGLLIARPGGGTISYVGELTYEDMGQMANFAFQSLRALEYSQMSVELNGTIGGQIITNIRMDGIRQGEGASRNFVTRELAKLPIRFIVNVTAENPAVLALVMRGLFDPTVFNTDAGRRSLGLDIVEVETPPDPVPEPDLDTADAQRREEAQDEPLGEAPSELGVQPSESEVLQ